MRIGVTEAGELPRIVPRPRGRRTKPVDLSEALSWAEKTTEGTEATEIGKERRDEAVLQQKQHVKSVQPVPSPRPGRPERHLIDRARGAKPRPSATD